MASTSKLRLICLSIDTPDTDVFKVNAEFDEDIAGLRNLIYDQRKPCYDDLHLAPDYLKVYFPQNFTLRPRDILHDCVKASLEYSLEPPSNKILSELFPDGPKKGYLHVVVAALRTSLTFSRGSHLANVALGTRDIVNPSALKLYCLSVDDPAGPFFKVQAEPGDDMMDLKDCIYEKQKAFYYDKLRIPPDYLRLYFPAEAVIRPESNLHDRAKASLESCPDLPSRTKLSTLFSNGPKKDHLHVVVFAAKAGSAEPRVTTVALGTEDTDGPPTKRLRTGDSQYDRGHYEFPCTIRRLNGTENVPEHRSAFKLHELLWNEKEAWTDIVHDSEEVVPDLDSGEVTDTSDAVSRGGTTLVPVQFIQVAGLADKEDETWRILEKGLLIRDEYKQFDEFLDAKAPYQILLWGQPGIGKTVYLKYCLLKRLVAGRPTIFALTPIARYLFRDNGVYWIPDDSYSCMYIEGITADLSGGLALIDLNNEQEELCSFMSWRRLVASSPARISYDRWTKEPKATAFVMKTWTWPEIYTSRSALENRSLNEWRAAFVKYGGSARTLLAIEESVVEKRIDHASMDCTAVERLFPICLQKASHDLVVINPRDGEKNRWAYDGRIISRYVFERLLEQKKAVLFDSMQNTYQDLLRSDRARGADRSRDAEILFEGAGHRYLFSSLVSPLSIRPLTDQSEPISLDLRHAQEVSHFNPDDIGPLATLDHAKYYLPLSSTVAGIDSFVLEVDGNGRPTSVVLFQFTTVKSHPIKAKFFPRLWGEGAETVDTFKWKLVFVVPKRIEFKIGVQPWEPPSAAAMWNDRVDQYVLGVEDSKLWNTFREVTW